VTAAVHADGYGSWRESYRSLLESASIRNPRSVRVDRGLGELSTSPNRRRPGSGSLPPGVPGESGRIRDRIRDRPPSLRSLLFRRGRCRMRQSDRLIKGNEQGDEGSWTRTSETRGEAAARRLERLGGRRETAAVVIGLGGTSGCELPPRQRLGIDGLDTQRRPRASRLPRIRKPLPHPRHSLAGVRSNP